MEALSPVRMGGAAWSGLSVAPCGHQGRVSLEHLHLSQAMLVLHNVGGAEVSVRHGASSWRFTTQAGSFDFYAPGPYAYLARRLPPGAVVIRIPQMFERLLFDENGAARPHFPRFQFRDRRLQRMIDAMVLEQSSLAGVHEVGIHLSLAVVDRLQELLLPPPAPARALSPLLRCVVADYLDQHLDTPVDAKGVARLTGLARTQFVQAFHDSFGRPLHQYIVHRRVEVAKRRLLATSVSVTELAQDLGFASHAHFTTVFKRQVTMTPSRFRQQHARHVTVTPP